MGNDRYREKFSSDMDVKNTCVVHGGTIHQVRIYLPKYVAE